MTINASSQGEFQLGYGGYSCKWGIHLAGLYETETERDEIIFGFLKEGMRNKDLSFYCPVERTADDFIDKFSQFCPETAGLLEDEGVFQLFSPKKLDYPGGIFSPLNMIENLNRFFDDCTEKYGKNIRATAEMTWALEAIPGREHLFAYEAALNNFIQGKRWASICLYNITKFDGDTLLDVLRTHPYTLNKGVMMENPYYQDPNIWLMNNAPQFQALQG